MFEDVRTRAVVVRGCPTEARVRAPAAFWRVSDLDRPPLAARHITRTSSVERMGSGAGSKHRAEDMVRTWSASLRGVPAAVRGWASWSTSASHATPAAGPRRHTHARLLRSRHEA